MLLLLPPFQCVRVAWFKLEVYGSGGLPVSHSQMNKKEATKKNIPGGSRCVASQAPAVFSVWRWHMFIVAIVVQVHIV